MDSSTFTESLTNSFSSEITASSTKNKSQGKQCVAYGCNSRYFDKNQDFTGLHFFQFPQENPDKLLWCNLIKRWKRQF